MRSASDASVPKSKEQGHALSDIVTAGRLDEHLVHVALGTLVHTLVDLVHQRERRARKLGEREQIRDRRQSALLSDTREQRQPSVASNSSAEKRRDSLLRIDGDH